MAATGFFHHIGTFLLFCATILLIITCISAPVVHDLAILKVDLGSSVSSGHANVAFGTFGYCINGFNGEGNNCSPSQVGYKISDVMHSLDGTQFKEDETEAANDLTKAMILHPIACGINFLAFILALGAGTFGSLLASIVAMLAFLVTLVIMVIDFVLFGIIKTEVGKDGTDASAYYSAAAWTILVSAICSLLGSIIVFFTCCSARIHRNRQIARQDIRAGKADAGYTGGLPRRHWV